MPIRFLFDENLPGRLRSAVVRHNARGIDPSMPSRSAILPICRLEPRILTF